MAFQGSGRSVKESSLEMRRLSLERLERTGRVMDKALSEMCGTVASKNIPSPQCDLINGVRKTGLESGLQWCESKLKEINKESEQDVVVGGVEGVSGLATKWTSKQVRRRQKKKEKQKAGVEMLARFLQALPGVPSRYFAACIADVAHCMASHNDNCNKGELGSKVWGDTGTSGTVQFAFDKAAKGDWKGFLTSVESCMDKKIKFGICALDALEFPYCNKLFDQFQKFVYLAK